MESKDEIDDVSKINLEQLGLVKQPVEFYTNLGNTFNQMNLFDRLCMIDLILEHLFNKNIDMSPVLMALMMEKFQSIEIKSATWKKMLGEQVVTGLVCKKCGVEYPKMNMLQLATGINNKCETNHNDIEIII